MDTEYKDIVQTVNLPQNVLRSGKVLIKKYLSNDFATQNEELI